MVRKAVRTYSQIVNDFHKADEHDTGIRAFYEPSSGLSTTAASQRPLSAARKHRYAHLLDWNDDITTIMAVDNYDGGARAPTAAVAAAGADRHGRASRALAAALHSAVEAAMNLQPSPVPESAPASRLAERLLRGAHGPLPSRPRRQHPSRPLAPHARPSSTLTP
ncbi:hypothetical protein GPECTOR_34g758 [Gonium pectorale]|uniref:Uncharacterized protein n=1 Tax=Gonium pectorale TaxID=33097 RepID=A0A150GCN4_GONPE|nr:hypothetical protein GPECTOR_34g758 [Gonium pectorale]|eukprot:KXZ47599.1 hypothetical protein GPECTOR_34g758 [Gonium pectorale]